MRRSSLTGTSLVWCEGDIKDVRAPQVQSSCPRSRCRGSCKGVSCEDLCLFLFRKASKRRFVHVVTVNILFCQGVCQPPGYIRTRAHGISRDSLYLNCKELWTGMFLLTHWVENFGDTLIQKERHSDIKAQNWSRRSPCLSNVGAQWEACPVGACSSVVGARSSQVSDICQGTHILQHCVGLGPTDTLEAFSLYLHSGGVKSSIMKQSAPLLCKTEEVD